MKKRDELNAMLTAAANPETAAEALADLATAITDVYDAYEGAVTQHNNDTATIASLRDSNMRLFLRLSGGNEDTDDDHEETLDEYNTRISKMINEEE